MWEDGGLMFDPAYQSDVRCWLHSKVGLYHLLADSPHGEKMRADISNHVTWFLANWSPDGGKAN
jgi:hypothetical protein